MFQSKRIAGLQRTCERSETPAFVQRYLKQAEDLRRLNTPIRNLRFVVLDTETTGLNIHNDYLLSIGAVVVQGGEIRLGESLEILFSYEDERPMKGTEIHGLTLSDLKNGSSPTKALGECLDFLGSDVLVGQHIGFDAAMIEQAVRSYHLPEFFLYNPRVDTATLAYKAEHPGWRAEMLQQSQYNLDALCERYHIPVIDRHTAWGDALATAELFLKLIRKIEKQGGTTLRHLLT